MLPSQTKVRSMNHDEHLTDVDAVETQEWLEALDSLREYAGDNRVEFVINELLNHAQKWGLGSSIGERSSYLNSPALQTPMTLPTDLALCDRVTAYARWNAIAMVMRAGKKMPELGGHLATYGSSATLFEAGFNYFFKSHCQSHNADVVFFQGHASPGIYARAYLEGRLTDKQLDCFRQEAFEDGLSSYPHPHLMPSFWQMPTVSMGLGPLTAIYLAQFFKYMAARGWDKVKSQRVWAFCGDGELGEPESLGALNIAARDSLDNLTFVISCNLQRLDGPVSGNSQIIQEYEGVFKGAGWNVIKLIWGKDWEDLLKKDTTGLLMKRMNELVDGEQQSYASKTGAYLREHFFGRYPELLELVRDLSDDELESLTDAGHEIEKVYRAYQLAVSHKGQPTVILAKTRKGFGMGESGEGLNVTHQTKKMNLASLLAFRDRFSLPLSDADVESLTYLKMHPDSEEYRFLQRQREDLGGYFPARQHECETLKVPGLSDFDKLLEGSGDRELSTTMVFARALGVLLKDSNIKQRIVPILVDESRTFGLEGLFRQIGIFSTKGQLYTPEDKSQLMYYREDERGQLLQQGISEAGGMASWTAAATSYSTTGEPMIPFFVYYSMFGFQRFGDLVWAAGDAQARGFIVGGTAGRTTLAGEGLQHQDGHNLIMFSMVPNCISYDPCFGYEWVVILQDGLRRMYEQQENVFYYITAMNENYQQPAMPKGVEDDILKGMYLFKKRKKGSSPVVRLLGGGTILREVIAAADILDTQYGVRADVWSVTSFNELRRDCEARAREKRLSLNTPHVESHVSSCLAGEDSPVIAATDYMKLYADQIRQDISAPYYTLGTDGYGRSDSRVALRRFFEVDANMIAYTALKALHDQGSVDRATLEKAQQDLCIDHSRPAPDKV